MLTNLAVRDKDENGLSEVDRSTMMCGTKHPTRQARAIPVRRGRQRSEPRRFRRAPVAALLLSLLALIAPDLTFAPLLAGEPRVGGHRPIDRVALPVVPHRALSDDVAGAATLTATATGATADEDAAYRVALEAARAYASAWGITFAAVRDGQVMWTGSSGRDRGGTTPLAPDSPLVIGSVTKTYVAATVLELVEEGRIGLDDSARDYLPDVTSVSPEITIRELLDHTSGLADVFNDTTRRGLEEHPEHAWTSDEVLGSLHAPWYDPGVGWAYANTNYYLLGMVVEAVTGNPLADELARRLFGPLGLHATRMLSPTDPTSPLPPAWATIFWGSGAMSATAADLARWGDAVYEGRVLDQSIGAAMLKFNKDDYGLGVQRLEMAGTTGYGHTGLLNTYTTLLYHLPRQHVTIALLVNRSHVDLSGMLAAHPLGDGSSLIELATGGVGE
jgi:D-alanyl-D-alanine carboxypeptidase